MRRARGSHASGSLWQRASSALAESRRARVPCTLHAHRAARRLHGRLGRPPARAAGDPRRCSTPGACARSPQSDHPVPGWRQACFYGGFVVIGAALTSLGSASQDLLYVHMIEHLLLGDIAALLIVLGLTGPLLAPVLRIRLFDRLRVLSHPADRLPAVGDRPVRVARAGALPGGAAPPGHPRARARDVPRLRHQHVDVPVRPAADAELVRQPRQAHLHRRRAPRRHGPRQHLPVVGHGLLPLLPPRRRASTTSPRSPTRTSPARS